MKMMKKTINKLLSAVMLLMVSITAQASQTGSMPWEQVLKAIHDSLSGPVAFGIASICLIGGGFALAFTDISGGAKKLIIAAMGISVAINANFVLTSFLHFNGATIC